MVDDGLKGAWLFRRSSELCLSIDSGDGACDLVENSFRPNKDGRLVFDEVLRSSGSSTSKLSCCPSTADVSAKGSSLGGDTELIRSVGSVHTITCSFTTVN
jgi:hypothetical protein